MLLLDVALEIIEPRVRLCACRALERLCFVNLEVSLQVVIPGKRVLAGHSSQFENSTEGKKKDVPLVARVRSALKVLVADVVVEVVDALELAVHSTRTDQTLSPTVSDLY